LKKTLYRCMMMSFQQKTLKDQRLFIWIPINGNLGSFKPKWTWILKAKKVQVTPLMLQVLHQRYYWPSQQVSIDEVIKKFKGRCSFMQYMKNKPLRWGLKIFCVCCSATGFLWNASIYCGRN
jgi:hypothetical protein